VRRTGDELLVILAYGFTEEYAFISARSIGNSFYSGRL
jgi:hypothetical protein